MSVKKVKEIGHSISRLYEFAKGENPLDNEEVVGIAKLVDSKYMRSRYILVGSFTRASNGALWRACCLLHSEIEPPLNLKHNIKRARHAPLIPGCDAEN